MAEIARVIETPAWRSNIDGKHRIRHNDRDAIELLSSLAAWTVGASPGQFCRHIGSAVTQCRRAP
jgi:hypothetical protein